MKKLFTLLFAAVMALSLSFATFAEDKPAAEKPAATDSKKKSKKTSDKKKAAADQKKARKPPRPRSRSLGFASFLTASRVRVYNAKRLAFFLELAVWKAASFSGGR